MSRDHISKPLKSCVLLHARTYNIPRQIFTLQPVRGSVIRSVRIGFIEDEFEMYVVRVTDVILRIVFYRDRRYPNEKPDDGYVLQFNFIMSGQDERKKVTFLKHDEEKTGVTFILSKEILSEAFIIDLCFDLLVVVQMLEFKSIDKKYNGNYKCEKRIDIYMSYMKSVLPKEDMRHLCYILRSPGLQDTFTGRLSPQRMQWILYIISVAVINLSKVAKYLSEKSKIGSDKIPNVDINWLPNYVVYENKELPLSYKDAILQKYRAHVLGLDFYKTITADYLVKIIDEDYVVLDILLIALLVQDEDLFGKAAFLYHNRYKEISRSGRFKLYMALRKKLMRVMLHTVEIWGIENGVHMPVRERPTIPTTDI